MKKFILSMTMLVLVLCLKTNVSNAEEISAMERLDYWDVSKEYTITNQDATYHAYLSKDKKESWIFKADVARDKKNVKVVIPDKIENAPVVIVGATSGYDEILAKQNLGSVGIQGPDGSYYLDAEVTLWGDLLEPWHCPGPYYNAGHSEVSWCGGVCLHNIRRNDSFVKSTRVTARVHFFGM